MPKRNKQRSGKAEAQTRDLSRAKVIEAGLDLLDRKGVDTLSMRSLADALGVTPMALYNHVRGKSDLRRAIAAHVLEDAIFDGGAADWRVQVEFCFREFRSVCLRHPWLARLLEEPDAAPASVFAPMEVALRALEAAGLSEIDSMRTYFILVGFTLSQASYESRGPIADLEPSERNRSKRIAGKGYDVLENLRLPAAWDFDAAFEFGLRLILDGVEAVVGRMR